MKYSVDVNVLSYSNTAILIASFDVEADTYNSAHSLANSNSLVSSLLCKYFLVITPYPF